MIRILAFFVSLCMLLTTFFGQLGWERKAPGEGLAAPVYGGCDPWYCQYDGVYYHCYSTGNGVGVKRADSVAGLSDARGVTVYSAPEGTDWSRDYWAPELYRIDGRWYIYVAADDGENENHRMYVLSSDSPQGRYTMEGKIAAPDDRWAIDGTLLQLGDRLYFVWSGWEASSDGSQFLYIAPMDSPTHISGERVMISKPEFKWEKNGMPINEGPTALYKDGETYIVYSASGSWTDDYCLGMLRLCGDDPLKEGCWAKCPVPVFKKTETAFGPGHCSFVSSPDGATDHIVYHANRVSGTGWNGRSVRVQAFTWKNKIPVFGKPLNEPPTSDRPE